MGGTSGEFSRDLLTMKKGHLKPVSPIFCLFKYRLLTYKLGAGEIFLELSLTVTVIPNLAHHCVSCLDQCAAILYQFRSLRISLFFIIIVCPSASKS